MERLGLIRGSGKGMLLRLAQLALAGWLLQCLGVKGPYFVAGFILFRSSKKQKYCSFITTNQQAAEPMSDSS